MIYAAMALIALGAFWPVLVARDTTEKLIASGFGLALGGAAIGLYVWNLFLK